MFGIRTLNYMFSLILQGVENLAVVQDQDHPVEQENLEANHVQVKQLI